MINRRQFVPKGSTRKKRPPLETIREYVKIQGRKGNWDYNALYAWAVQWARGMPSYFRRQGA